VNGAYLEQERWEAPGDEGIGRSSATNGGRMVEKQGSDLRAMVDSVKGKPVTRMGQG